MISFPKKYPFFSVGFFLLVPLFFAVSGTASASVYAPGQTLNPDCAMGSANCGVSLSSSFIPYSGASSSVDFNNQSLFNVGSFALGTTSNSFFSSISSTTKTYISSPVEGARVLTDAGNGCPWGVTASGTNVYVADNCVGIFSVFDVSNPLSPVEVATTSVGNGSDYSYYVALSGHYAYVTDGASDLAVIDVSNQSAPVQVATTTIGNDPNNFDTALGIAISGHYAFIADYNDGLLSVVDISNPLSPVQVATTSVGAGAWGVALSGNYAYVTNSSDNTVSVVDISNPLSPNEVATVGVGDFPLGIAISGTHAYVANEDDNTVSVVDISNPLSPSFVTSASVGGSPFDVAISGTNAYVTNDDDNTVSVVNISNPSSPSVSATVSLTGSGPVGIAIEGDYAYVSNDNSSDMSVVKISNTVTATTTSSGAYTFQVFGQGTSTIAAFFASTSVPVFTIASDGHIGIGTTTPSSALSVVGTTTLFGLNLPSLSSGILEVDGSGNIFATSSSLASQWTTVGQNIFYTGGVKVGSGAEAPTASSWATGTLPMTSGDYSRVFYGGGTFVAVGGATSAVSPDGTNWATGTLPASSFWSSMAYGNGTFLVVSDTRFAVSSDGINWTEGLMPSPHPSFFNWPWHVAYGNGMFVALAGDQFATSTDGMTWATSSLPASSQIWTVAAYQNGLFIGIGNGSGLVTSSDGENWTGASFPFNNPVDIASGNGVLVVDGSDQFGNHDIATSSDGVNWSIFSQSLLPQGALAFGNGVFVSSDGYTSFDGSNWASHDVSALQSYLNFSQDIAFGGNSFVMVGGTNSFAITSPGAGVQAASFEAFGTAQSDVANFITSAGASALYITSEGDVGIGTTSPQYPLVVNGTIMSYSDADHIVQIASTSVGLYPQNIIVDGRYAYVSSNYDNRGPGSFPENPFSVVDISNPAAPRQIATTSVEGASSIGLAKSGHYVYVVNNGEFDHDIAAIDVANPAAPRVVSTTTVDGNYPTGIAISEGHAYVTVGGLNGAENGFDVFDLANPGFPRLVATTSVGFGPAGVAVSGKYAYVTNSGDLNGTTISVVDISNPLSPVQVATTSVGRVPTAIALSGSYAYVANFGEHYISILDISNPLAPVEVATSSVGNDPIDIAVSGNYVYTADQQGSSMSVTNVSDPLHPYLVASVPTPSWTQGVAVSGRYVYTANSEFNSDTHEAGSVSVIDTGGLEAESARIGSLETGRLNVDNSLTVGDFLNIGSGLFVGAGGIFANGALAVTSTDTPSYFAGKLGIGTSTPGANLTASGTVQFSSFGAGTLQTDANGNLTVSSDERLKDIVSDFTPGLDALRDIVPITYHWNATSGLDTLHAYSGFSAQNVEANIPEAVATDSRGYLTLDERPILAAVVNAVKAIGSFITSVGDGLAHLTGIAIGTSQKPEGITMYDEATGAPYCLVIVNGNLITEAGECSATSTGNIVPLGTGNGTYTSVPDSTGSASSSADDSFASTTASSTSATSSDDAATSTIGDSADISTSSEATSSDAVSASSTDSDAAATSTGN